MATNNINTTLTATDKTKKAFNSMRRNVQGVNQQFAALRNTIIAAVSVREIVQAADTFKGLENRMMALTGSVEKTSDALAMVKRIANESRSDIGAVGDLFTKLQISTTELNVSLQDIADATQTVVNTFVISGSTAQEAANSARQLAQGLASGALRGDELRSVMENNVILTTELSKGLGVTTGDLKKMGAEGLLTAEKVLPILLAATERTTETVGNMGVTIGQSVTLLRNNFTIFVAEVEKTTGIIRGLSNVFGFISNNIDTIMIPILSALALNAIPLVITQFQLLNATLRANPFIAIAGAVIAFITLFYHFRNEIATVIHSLFVKQIPLALLEVERRFYIFMGNIEKSIAFPLKQIFVDMVNGIIGNFNSLIEKINELVGMLPGFVKDKFGLSDTGFGMIDLLGDPTSKASEYEEKVNEAVAKAEEIRNKTVEPITMMELVFGRKTEEKGTEGEGADKEVEKELSPIFLAAKNGFDKFVDDIKPTAVVMEETFTKGFKTLEDQLVNFVTTGKASFKEFADFVVQQLLRVAIQQSIIAPLASAMNFDVSSLTGKKAGATGGMLMANRPYMVGEHGKELFIPNQTGRLLPNNQTKAVGGEAVNVNFNIQATDATGIDDLLLSRKNQIVAMVSQAMNQRGKPSLV